MPKFSSLNVAIYMFLVILALLFILALYGWLSGAWERDENNAYLNRRSTDPICVSCAR